MINISDKIIIFDDNKPTYNIGDLLNMPYFWAGWLSNPHFSEHHYNAFILTANAYPNSILNIYKHPELPMEMNKKIYQILNDYDCLLMYIV